MVTIRGTTITPALQPQTKMAVSAQGSQPPRLTVSVPMLVPAATTIRKPQALAPKVNNMFQYTRRRGTKCPKTFLFSEYIDFKQKVRTVAAVSLIFQQWHFLLLFFFQIITQSARAPFTVQSIPVSVSHTPSALTMNKKTGELTDSRILSHLPIHAYF